MNALAFFGGGAPGPFEILIILFVILLLFGARRLPDLARSLGRSLSEFKKGRDEGHKSEIKDNLAAPRHGAAAGERPDENESAEKKT